MPEGISFGGGEITEVLKAFNHPNFVPVGGLGNDIADYEVTGLTGTNTSRVIQLVTRINW